MKDDERATTGTWLALLTGVAIGLGIWSGARHLFGINEAWDAPSYFFVSLLISGIFGGLIFRKNYFMLYLGTVLGQVMYLGYLLASLDDVGQGLLPVGLLFLLLFSMISYCSAAGAAFIIRQCLDRR